MNSRTPQTPANPATELDVEREIKAKGLTAPRVKLEDLDAEIVDSQFYVFPGSTVTVALLMLANGFTVTGESACASPENFDEKLGRDIAYRNARDKLWSLLGFRLKDRLHAEARGKTGTRNAGEVADPLANISADPRREVGAARMGDVLVAAARAAHEVNRAYCDSTGDQTQVPWDAAPEWQKTSAIEGVRALLAKPELTPADMHALWCDHKRADGWRYGPEKDTVAKLHPCLVDYDQLPAGQRVKDYLFRAAVLNTAHAAGWVPTTGPVVRALADGAAVSPDRVGGGTTEPRMPEDVGAIAPELGNLTATEKLAAEASIGAATGRTGNADTFLEERRRRNLADKPANPAGRVDANARVGSTVIDNTPEKDA